MFRYRPQVNFVRDPKPTKEATPKTDPREYIAQATVITERAVKGIAVLYGAYMAADTIRTIAIHTAVTKIK